MKIAFKKTGQDEWYNEKYDVDIRKVYYGLSAGYQFRIHEGAWSNTFDKLSEAKEMAAFRIETR